MGLKTNVGRTVLLDNSVTISALELAFPLGKSLQLVVERSIKERLVQGQKLLGLVIHPSKTITITQHVDREICLAPEGISVFGLPCAMQ